MSQTSTIQLGRLFVSMSMFVSMLQTESGCSPLSCAMDVGSLSCGYFQIKDAYWQDCGSIGGSK